MQNIFFSGLVLFSLFLFGCGQNEAISGQLLQNDLGSTAPTIVAPPQESVSPPMIRSDIDFSGINWPREMTLNDQRAIELALNISGSFEGNESWINISDNSDKQGMSLGLLSQNFGSGTLQPLLLKMHEVSPGLMAKIFSQAHLTSLYNMLNSWQTQTPPIVPKDRGRISLLDLIPMADPDSNSVSWAIKNLYAGARFIPQWKFEFQTLAATQQYINLQIGDAFTMHSAAKAYAIKTGVNELRSYLMMFDVVDQNGNMPDVDYFDYQIYLKANPKASNTARLQELASLRVRHVNPVYAPDVKSRKLAIINGQGLVHQMRRNLETEFNFSRLETY